MSTALCCPCCSTSTPVSQFEFCPDKAAATRTRRAASAGVRKLIERLEAAEKAEGKRIEARGRHDTELLA